KDANVTINFEGEKWTLDYGSGEIEGTLKIDAAKKPKTIDLSMNGEDRLGIYEIDGDTLKICYNDPGEERPKEFKSKEDTKISLSAYKRVKDKDKDKGK